MQAAIETVADLGYPNTSFSKIAKRAGLSSTGMISYYFAGKAELLQEVVATVFCTAEQFVAPRLEGEPSHRGKLRAYIEANCEFMAKYPRHTLALVEIIVGTRYRNNTSTRAITEITASDGTLVDCLTRGRDSGEFGDIEPQVMAVAVRGAIDNTLRQFMLDPDTDLERYGRQIADIFDRATRPDR